MSVDVFKVPLVPVAQRFGIKLGTRSLILVNRWNGEVPAWMLDIYDADTNAPVILSLALVTGTDLLSQFRHLDLPGSLVCFTEGDVYAPPTEDNLGGTSNLYYVVNS